MRRSIHTLALLLAIGPIVVMAPQRGHGADPDDRSNETADRSGEKSDPEGPAINLLDAMRARQVSGKAEGIGDGRMTMSLTNRTKKQLRVVLPPRIIAQGATGQFGGMGGMGGGMMGGGMGGGMMGGGMGGGGMGGGGGGMSGMGMQSCTMPSTMGMMMLSRMIMYFCGDPQSWDQRSLMIGMMAGGMGGGMGGGMMGGMGGGMGGMGSVPPTELPTALLKPGQPRELPTRLVSVSSPDPQRGLVMPEKGERLEIVGDVAQVNDNPLVSKALKRLAADKAPTAVAQLVMWRVSAGLDWETIADLSNKWANDYELALARDFVERLNSLTEGESARLRIDFRGNDEATASTVAEAVAFFRGKIVLGLPAEIGTPERPDGPTVACRARLTLSDAQVQVFSSDAAARNWVAVDKFTLAIAQKDGKFDAGHFAEALTEGILNRLVRAQLAKGPRAKGKATYQIRIDNASPLILNGLAAVGSESEASKTPRLLSGICISPRRSMTVPASEDVVRMLGLKKGIRLVALDLSGL
jgi:hypothetical protein